MAVYVAAYCGLRARALGALRRDDVDLLNGRLTVDEALKEVNGADPTTWTTTSADSGPPKSAGRNRRENALPRKTAKDRENQPSTGSDGGIHDDPSTASQTAPVLGWQARSLLTA